MGGVILTVSYNRARIVLYGDIVRADSYIYFFRYFFLVFYQNPKGEPAGMEGV